MKITQIELLPVACELKEPLRWGSMKVTRKGNVLVRIHTDEGISGIGEAGYSIDFHAMLSAIIENILIRDRL